MTKMTPASPGKDRGKPDAHKPLFGAVRLAPRLESAFVFPAAQRPGGLDIHGSKKGSPAIPKKF